LKYKRFYILLFCFVFVLQLYAQDKNKAIALKTVLVAIENQHHVSFNYTENLVIDLEIAPPPIDFSLNEKLNYLESKTHLSFENINNRFITIYDKETEQKKLVCGYVFSEVDNLPLEKANVNFANGESCTTNKVGYFEIKTQKITDFIVSYVGFKNQKVLVSDFDPTCPKIILIPQITVLEEINTTQYLASGITKRQDESFVIKPKKFGILPGLIEPDVLQTMQQIPGINSADESVASINVRGGTHDQNLFLWNGIKMYQTGHFFGLISAFNPNLAHTINISKNGSSAFFGESVSSVIAISSDQNQSEKNSFSGGINMINADIYAKFNINKKGYLEITSRKSITDFAKSPTYDQYFTKAFQNTAVTDFGNNQNSVLKNESLVFMTLR
jgi:TonB-dependent Receptor Plug Domain